jgi:GTP-binding protein HflX
VVLREIGADEVPELLVINKADAAPDDAKMLEFTHDGSVTISAASGGGIDDLLETLGDRLRTQDRIVALRIPHARGDIVAAAHREGDVVETHHDDDATTLHVVLDGPSRARFQEFEVAG